MNFKRKLLNAAVMSVMAGSAGLSSVAGAVTLGDDGLGEVQLYPYYTARGGNDTAFSVVNTTDFGKAVKVRILEGKNSREVIDFNLYLSPNDVWAGIITQTADGARLVVTDNSCTVPAIDATQGGPGFVDFRNFQYAGSNGDGESVSLDRSREGYIEIIEMGQVSEDFPIERGTSTQTIQFISAITHSSGVPADCAAVRKAWTLTPPPNRQFSAGGDELTSPGGGLMGSGTLINVANGTDFSYDPVALDGFYDPGLLDAENLHTAPGSLNPTLEQVTPKESSVFVGGQVISSSWTVPDAPLTSNGSEAADPVSAVLMRSAVLNEYVTEVTLAAGTDWVVNFPTKRFYVDPDTDTDADNADLNYDRPFSNDFKLGGACEGVGLHIFNREEGTTTQDVDFSPPPPSGRNELCWEVNVITFNSTDVLGSSLRANVNTAAVGDSGWMRLSFPFDAVPDSNVFDGQARVVRQMDDGDDTYHGLPVIGFAVQEYVNGNVGGVLSNYGGSFIHKYERDIDD
jgi:hypothetical protein